ncbi:MAG: L,D-transpeptidase [Chloroflexi bacterium]|nr:L,D-transpeptidase [Chloroflexota bacterium]
MSSIKRFLFGLVLVLSLLGLVLVRGVGSRSQKPSATVPVEVNSSSMVENEKASGVSSEEIQLKEPPSPPVAVESGKWLIAVYLTQRRLYLYNGSQLMSSYEVAIGKQDSPTPVDRWQISEKIVNPGPGTQFGTRWMRINSSNPATGAYERTDYGIHGTDEEDKIGTPVSAGCVRMRNQDIEAVFDLVPLGTAVVTLP